MYFFGDIDLNNVKLRLNVKLRAHCFLIIRINSLVLYSGNEEKSIIFNVFSQFDLHFSALCTPSAIIVVQIITSITFFHFNSLVHAPSNWVFNNVLDKKVANFEKKDHSAFFFC